MVFLFRLLSRLPLWAVHYIGAALGWAAYGLSPTYRRHLKANMAQAGIAFSPAAVGEAGKQAVEPARIWLRTLDETNAQVIEVHGWNFVEAAQQAGRGIVFLTPHLGCFEITAQYYSAFGDVTVLYRPPKSRALQEMIQAGRRRVRLHLAPADLSGVRALIKALKKGQAVGILPDQAPKTGEGTWLDFFGRPAYTMTLAARLTETGATT
ncbi:MAG TPA: lysophospholipid acyltransferase family protein, partial [Rhodocyclaceae bacterium]|nr:lysophospholipid acyltransferase family protein [Rhodocyclaceae bacterium]